MHSPFNSPREAISTFRADTRGQSATSSFRKLATLSVLLVVAVVVLNEVFDALPDVDSGSNLSDAMNTTEELTGTALELAPIVLIVIVAAAVLAILSRRF